MKLSIITIHLDQWQSLERTARSLDGTVARADVEWIVVDGDSSVDSSSAEVIRNNIRSMADRFISEPDNGIYQAMNKGTKLASGTHALYLNAGDELHPGFDLEAVWKTAHGSDLAMIWGQAWDRDSKGNVYLRKSRSPAWLKFGIPVCHQAVIFRRDLLGDAPYRESLTIAGDYELMCRLSGSGKGIEMIATPIVIFELEGISSSRSALAMSEESAIRQEYFPKPVFVENALSWTKHTLWKSSMRFPGLRRFWRRWV